jgi:hypothetical protein
MKKLYLFHPNHYLYFALLWVLVFFSSLAHAASYSLPLNISSAPFGCTLLSGTTYDCPSSITLSNNDSVTASSSSLTLIVNGNVDIPNNVTWGNSSFNINVIAIGTVTLGNSNNTDFFGNIIAATVNMGANASVSGTCTTNSSFTNSGNWAVRAGTSWAISTISTTPTACPVSPTTFNVDGFTVSVTCDLKSFDEGGVTKRVFSTTSTSASASAVGTIGRTERSLSATLEY